MNLARSLFVNHGKELFHKIMPCFFAGMATRLEAAGSLQKQKNNCIFIGTVLEPTHKSILFKHKPMKHFILLKIFTISVLLLFFAGFTALAISGDYNGMLRIEHTVFLGDTLAPGGINDLSGSQADSTQQENLLQKNTNQPTGSFQEVHFKVYPNPGQGMFHLEIHNKTSMPFDFGVYDLTGKEIWQKNTPCVAGCKIDINLQSFNDGIYLLKIQSGNQQKVLKLLKQ